MCPQGHAFDVARAGYVNLLQPQDRRSRQAGDSPDSVAARAALLAAGQGRGTLTAVVNRAAALPLPHTPAIVIELGCGSGEALALLAARRPVHGVGIDLSTAAATRAARACPELTWVVANADRDVPVIDGAADLVLSIHARRNPTACRRVLSREGYLLVAVPAPDDLIEMRTAVHGTGQARDRVAALVAEHAVHFDLVEQFTVRERHDLDRDALARVLVGTYRGLRRREAPRREALAPMRVTFASDIVLFAPRRSGA